ncbi:octaprenyl diphosphate synthase [Gallibacterium anatis]|uniref:Octaprenyl diphosphate synthase n=2 Tax=Gallibacterium anatis TaxID=750 RepID=A0A0A2YT13_9PAST|nr:octaprenyl diphosphate synthase [Gallibacterium anatis]AEC17011.1 octaprenyl diphosphate synthase [Gallibacterium anatis UMN179]KGQ28971.1 octaprenyl diphosphate synthase [Gallibacterium anatis]KGQ29684.1 octaprenyl diphosphate synthase [Gallibacterium anatis]KGQ42755.1 octaprenyl diphosphate synthase [Gallibacterium anatis IPDH697-78]KGQ45660.1 octaprenyl diphosphate synthase [Gallibacterium anatis]
MDLNEIQALSAKDMQAVNAMISQQLQSDVALINQLSFYIINGGGKRIRPLIAVLVANALNYQGDRHITCATFIEFIHTATLLHDDVVDESTLRRGKDTANAIFGNAASVLVGDFIYTRAFQLMARLGSLPVMQVMSDAVNVIAAGEVLQLMNCNDPDTTEQSYMQVIYSKTARLFEVAAECSALLSEATEQQVQAMKLYGRYLGTAFQLIDDVLDYCADVDKLGKNLGDDLEEGKPTLPLLHAMQHASEDERQLIRSIIEHGHGRKYLAEVQAMMDKYQSLTYTIEKAKQEAQKAIDSLSVIDDNPYKEALISLAKISVERSY